MYDTLNMITKKFDLDAMDPEDRRRRYDMSKLDGPWNTEPDKAQWVDPATDLDCLIVRNPMGSLCGYVGVTQDHPWFGKEYSACTKATETGECRFAGMTRREVWEEHKAELLAIPEDERNDFHTQMLESQEKMMEGRWGDSPASCYEHSVEGVIDIHGGLTYSNSCQEEYADGICHVPQNGRPAEVWWFGFDCGHSFDLSPGMKAFELNDPRMREIHDQYPGHDRDEVYRDFDYVVQEVTKLAEQMKAAQ